MFNLLADLYATEKGEQYVLDRKNDVFSGLGSYLRKDRDALEQAENIVESLDGISIVPLCGNLEKELHKVPALDVVDLSVRRRRRRRAAAHFGALLRRRRRPARAFVRSGPEGEAARNIGRRRICLCFASAT